MYVRKPSYRVGVWGREDSPIFTDLEAGGLLQNAIYIYIYIYTQNSLFWGRKKKGFWIGFSMIFRYRFKAPLEGLEDIRVGFWRPLEVFFS